MKVSEKIRAIRKGKGITQVDMSEKMGVGQSNYAYLEDRGDKLTIEQLGRIAAALGVSVEELLTGEPQRERESERVKELEAELKNEKALREHFRRMYSDYNLIITNYFREIVFKEALKLGIISPELEPFDIYKHYKIIDVVKIYRDVLSKDELLTRLIRRGLFVEVGLDLQKIQIGVENEYLEKLKKAVAQIGEKLHVKDSDYINLENLMKLVVTQIESADNPN